MKQKVDQKETVPKTYGEKTASSTNGAGKTG
jgi:hypothetical protein